MFYQNWKLSLITSYDTLSKLCCKKFRKRISKVTTEQMTKAGIFNSYLFEIFKNHKLIKIFQKENYEQNRASQVINDLKKKLKNNYHNDLGITNNGIFNRNNDSLLNLCCSNFNC